MSGEKNVPPLPKGGVSLSERIAALQRKNSNSVASRPKLSPNSSFSSLSSGRISPADSPSRVGASSKAIKDRIARFQVNDDKKPLVPRSSFGAPAPNPDISAARRQYPGASLGRGTGSWGEGVLRPQMTGGVWLGAGAAGGWGDPSAVAVPMRPQLTGGAFMSGSARSSSFGATRSARGASSEIRGSGKDAFAELDQDIILTGRNRPEPYMASTISGSPTEIKSFANGKRDGLPHLPSVPQTAIDASKVVSSNDSNQGSERASSDIPDFPKTPSSVPKTTLTYTNGQNSDGYPSPDTSIEIGIHASSAQDIEKLREKARDLDLRDSKDEDQVEDHWVPKTDEQLAKSVPKPVDASELVTLPVQSSQTDQEPWVAGYGNPGTDKDMAVVAKQQASEPEPASAAAVVSPAQSTSLPTSRDDMAERNSDAGSVAGDRWSRSSFNSTTVSIEIKARSSSTDEYSNDSTIASTPFEKSTDTPVAFPTVPSIPFARSGSNGTITMSGSAATLRGGPTLASTSSATLATLPSDFISNATIHINGNNSDSSSSITSSRRLTSAEKARQAVALARNKSQTLSKKLRRPPPGTVFTAADLDASDDDYEPGWASVISSSRKG